MSITLDPKFRYRMPVVFGPAPGPRQRPGGGMWLPEETGRMNATWMAVSFRTDPAKLEAILPPGMSLRGEPVVTVSCAWFKNLYWLAGRGYGIVAVDFPVRYEGKSEILNGTFCPVLWEGAPDAITTGRDELGFPKMYADVAEIEWDQDQRIATCSASWMGFRFFDIALFDLTEAGGEPGLPGANDGPAMYFKYVPRTSVGGSEGADVAYVTTAAPPAGCGGNASNVKFDGFEFKRWSARGDIAWHRATFEQLPLSFHVVNGMADIDILEPVSAELVTFSGPGIGISTNTMRAVEPA
jgi:hypothetical protein